MSPFFLLVMNGSSADRAEGISVEEMRSILKDDYSLFSRPAFRGVVKSRDKSFAGNVVIDTGLAEILFHTLGQDVTRIALSQVPPP